METATYSFDVKQEGDRYVFTYTPPRHSLLAGLGTALPIALFSIIGSCYVTNSLTGPQFSVATWLVMTAVVGAGLYALVMYLMNMNRRPGTFTVTSAGIRVGEKDYDRTHITSLYIDPPGDGRRNAVHVDTVGPSVVTVHRGPSVAAITDQGLAALNQTGRQLVATGAAYKQLSEWGIGFRYGERDVELARGLRENTANVMFDRLQSIYELTRPARA